MRGLRPFGNVLAEGKARREAARLVDPAGEAARQAASRLSFKGMRWDVQPGRVEGHILSEAISGSNVRRWLRRVRPTQHGGFYVQRYRGAGSAWGAMEPLTSYATVADAQRAAEESVG